MPEKPRRSLFRKIRRFLRWGVLLLVLLLGLLFIPDVFQGVVRQGIRFETWRRGGYVQIGRVEGSFFRPVVLSESRWRYRSRTGAVTRLEIARAEAVFAWRTLQPSRGGRWFERLSLEGVVGKVEIPPPTEEGNLRNTARDEGAFPLAWFPRPARVEGKGVDLLFQCGSDYVRLQESRWRLSELETGSIEIARLVLKQPWLTRTFRDVRGTTAMKDGGVVLADLRLDPRVLIKRFSAELIKVARGSLDLELEVAAFGGNISAEAKTNAAVHGPEFDGVGSFSKIDLASLATFLGVSEAAGGTIETGTFKFRGSPREPYKSTAELRLEATNFQWEKRQWDSFVVGAALLEGRVQIPELVLRQGHNHLWLNGEMAFPSLGRGGPPWWQSDFNFKLAAQIDNLPELSALLLPEFQYAAGKIGIDGSISAKDRQFTGHLLVTGTDMSWRETSIQELRGAIRLSGQEIQIASLDLLNQDDYLHGQGVVSLGLGVEYRGDFRASIQDFAEYASLLENPLLPTPLAGGAVLRWSGQGKGQTHAGRFYARLQKLRLPRAEASMPHPVSAEFEGAYEPGLTQFTRFSLADEECDLTAQVKLTWPTLDVRDLRLAHKGQVWLQGEALLPLDFWQEWMAPSGRPPPVPGAPLKLNLKATGLSLKHAVRLSGWNWPVEGFVDGQITGGGALGQLQLAGQGTLRSGLIPIGWHGETLSGVSGELQAAGQVLSFVNGRAEYRGGKYTGRAQLDLASFWDPAVAAELECDSASFAVFEELQPFALNADGVMAPTTMRCDAALGLRIAGPLTSALVEGQVRLLRFHPGGPLSIAFLWDRKSRVAALPPPFSATVAPFSNWRLQLAAELAEPAPITPGEGTILPQLQIRGTAGQPQLSGTVRLAGLPAQAGSLPLVVKELTVNFAEHRPRDPMLDLHATGVIEQFPFNAYILGPLSNHMAFADSEKALALFGPGAEPLQGDTTPLRFLEQPSATRNAPSLPWPAIIP